MTPQQKSRLDSYERFGNPIALISAFIFLVSWVFRLVPTLDTDGVIIVSLLFYGSWLTMVFDYFTRAVISGHFFIYIIRHPFGFLGALFPPFRLLYLMRAVSILHRARNKLIAQTSIAAVVILALTIVLGAALVLHYEYQKPGSDIESYGEAIWWAFETISTVGYGDFVPVTVAGRTVAVTIMIIGVGLASVAAAAVVGFFVNTKKSTEPQTSTSQTPSAKAGHEQDLMQRLDVMEAKLDRLLKHATKPVKESDSTKS